MDALNSRLYESYASTHAGIGTNPAAALVYRRDIRPHLPTPTHHHVVLDIGCGQGELVRLMQADGYDARGVDFSPEQVAIAKAARIGGIVRGDFHDYLAQACGTLDAVVATDVLEHMVKADVLSTFDHVLKALRPGAVFVARVPNAVSPMGGHIMFGDVTHETWFTQHSVAQLAAVAGFSAVRAFSCPPVVHGPASAVRALAWKPVSGLLKLVLAAETGQLRGHIITQNLTFVAYRGAIAALPVPPAPPRAPATTSTPP